MNDRGIEQARQTSQLPLDNVPVITMDFSGGYGLPRTDDHHPLFTVFTDGTVKVTEHRPGTKVSVEDIEALLKETEASGTTFTAEQRQSLLDLPGDEVPSVDAMLETNLSTEDLQDLLHFIIREQEFFQFDSSAVAQEIQAEQEKRDEMLSLSDYPTTTLRVHTAERDHKIAFYALAAYATAYPAIESLVRMSLVQERLLRLVYEIRAGGKAGLVAALK